MAFTNLVAVLLETGAVHPDTLVIVYRDTTGTTHVSDWCEDNTTGPIPTADDITFAELAALTDACPCVHRPANYLAGRHLGNRQVITLQQLHGPDTDATSPVRTVALLRNQIDWLHTHTVDPFHDLAATRIVELERDAVALTDTEGYAAEAGYHLLRGLRLTIAPGQEHRNAVKAARDRILLTAGAELRNAVDAAVPPVFQPNDTRPVTDRLTTMLTAGRRRPHPDPIGALTAVWQAACTDLTWYRLVANAIDSTTRLPGLLPELDATRPELVRGPTVLAGSDYVDKLTPLVAGSVPAEDLWSAWRLSDHTLRGLRTMLDALTAART